MKIQSITVTLRQCGLGLFLFCTMGLITGCQSPPPLNPSAGCVHTTTDQNYPDGIRHLAGGPLYYETQNLNWEQAPPFGTW